MLYSIVLRHVSFIKKYIFDFLLIFFISILVAPKDWETEIANMTAAAAAASAGVTTSSRRSSSAASPSANSALSSALQPPPAHQHAPLTRQNSGQFSKPAVPPLKTPPPSSMGGAMDLSSR